jgi:P27 family predicted phage terminase small subunit
MGKRGPRGKLPEIERLEGNPGKRTVVDDGVSGLGSPFIADHLAADAKECIAAIKASMPPKIYSALDSYILAAFATAWSIHKRATEEVANPEFCHIAITPMGDKKPHAWLKILNEQAKLMASLGDRLGLDPKSRAALSLPKEDKPVSKFAGLVALPGGRK